MRIDRKAGWIFHIARILQDQPEEKVRAVFYFTQSYCTGFNPWAQQNPDFVEPGTQSRIPPKSVGNPPLPDLITDVLDRARRL